MNIRMGQINSGFSWNTAPGTFNPYGEVARPQIPNTFGGSPAYPTEDIGAGVAAPAECFTCTNPSTGDTQYGVPAASASQLKANGYRCRKDDCANSAINDVNRAVPGLMNAIQNLFKGISQQVSQQTFSTEFASPESFGSVPLDASSLGRRALS